MKNRTIGVLLALFIPMPVRPNPDMPGRIWPGTMPPTADAAGEKGRWNASVNRDGTVDLTLIRKMLLYSGGNTTESDGESRTYTSIRRGRFDMESPYDFGFTETIEADGLGQLFRRSKDPDRFAYQKGE